MRKIKTKGRKWTVKKVDNGPTFCVALHKPAPKVSKTIEALTAYFDISEDLAQVAVKTAPLVLIGDLSQHEASKHAANLKKSGEFRVWLSSAAGRMKKMNFKIRESEPIAN
jgi:hypothetical protein